MNGTKQQLKDCLVLLGVQQGAEGGVPHGDGAGVPAGALPGLPARVGAAVPRRAQEGAAEDQQNCAQEGLWRIGLRVQCSLGLGRVWVQPGLRGRIQEQ